MRPPVPIERNEVTNTMQADHADADDQPPAEIPGDPQRELHRRRPGDRLGDGDRQLGESDRESGPSGEREAGAAGEAGTPTKAEAGEQSPDHHHRRTDEAGEAEVGAEVFECRARRW